MRPWSEVVDRLWRRGRLLLLRLWLEVRVHRRHRRQRARRRVLLWLHMVALYLSLLVRLVLLPRVLGHLVSRLLRLLVRLLGRRRCMREAVCRMLWLLRGRRVVRRVDQ